MHRNRLTPTNSTQRVLRFTQIHKILTNSPAEKDGRLRKGDRILSINGLSMRGLTHRESLSVLKVRELQEI